MKRLFLSITKGEELRFLGHLDFLRTLERAILRAGIPAVFSEGFNPHMRLSLDAALGVGVAADPIYLELRVEDTAAPETVKENLAKELLPGISVRAVLEAEPGWPKLINFLNEDCYEAEGPVTGEASAEEIEKNIAAFNALSSFMYERVTPKKTRVLDVVPMLTEPIRAWTEGPRAYVRFSLVRTTAGSVQPKDIWKILAESFAFPVTPGEFVVKRIGAYHREGDKRTAPFDEGAFWEAAK